MSITQSTAGSHARPTRPGGFTLVELTVAVTVMGVLIGMSAMRFGQSIEQSRADFAVANLRAIWAAQRLYWLENHVYADKLSQDTPKGLYELGLLDPAIVGKTGDHTYNYTITLAGNDAFSVEAIREGGTGWVGTLTIDQTGTIGGSISAGEIIIEPGFQ